MTAETEGRVYNVGGQDWDEVVNAAAEEAGEERLIINMGPQHPSTHGVLRLILTLDGETVTELRPVIGYLHTGIEKNMEFRTWTQGVTFCTRMDYLAPIFNETVYCLAVERLLGIEQEIPERATVHAGAHDGAEPDLLAHDGDRHVRAGTRRDHRPAVRAEGTGKGARPVRAHHGPADEPRLCPAGRGVPGPPARCPGRAQGVPACHAAADR